MECGYICLSQGIKGLKCRMVTLNYLISTFLNTFCKELRVSSVLFFLKINPYFLLQTPSARNFRPPGVGGYIFLSYEHFLRGTIGVRMPET